ncbi:MAG TPA: DUF4918 domain-containing protein, partial [Chitinophagaceae bacterium]
MPGMLADKITHVYKELQAPAQLPKGINVLFPQRNKEVMRTAYVFFNKYYSDNIARRLLFGINPGRFGGGITGINFTAPKQLKENCVIDHPFGNSSELSAEFIYEVIERYRG